MVSLRVRIVLLCAAAAVLIPQALGSITRHENIALKCGGRSAMVGVNTTHLTKEMSQSDLICHPAFFTARNDKNICHEPFTFVQRITYQVRVRIGFTCMGLATRAWGDGRVLVLAGGWCPAVDASWNVLQTPPPP